MITIPLIVCVIGIVLYLATDGKPSRVGEIMFGVGLFVVLWGVGGTRVL